jgi:hypothetical protein
VTDTDRDVYRHYDGGHGRAFAIRRNLDGCPPLAIVDCDPYGSGETAFIPPHEVPKACRALHEAAGLPVPDIPDIPDPLLIAALADDLRDAMAVDPGMSYPPATGTYADALARSARALLARGWGRTS